MIMGYDNRFERFTTDLSAYDSSIQAILITIAFEEIRDMFPKSRRIDKDFKAIVKTFINTPIIMPDGYVYVKNKGVPSGTSFTNIIDSLVNGGVGFSVLSENNIEYNINTQSILGDDSTYSIDPRYCRTEDMADMFGKGYAEYGLVCHPDKCLIGSYYLGRLWDIRRGVSKEPEKPFERLFLPERNRYYQKGTHPENTATATFQCLGNELLGDCIGTYGSKI
jgi:hypothetical protein